jgi:phenylpropionate dioxygenase-like ring-hydroxylating dioxygenase large terminal subunit
MKPSHFYFDERMLEKEQALFDQCRFLAHRLQIDENSGRNYYCLPQENDARVLINNSNGTELLSNVCKHRQAVMLQGAGNVQNIVCPLHGWTYNREGSLQAAPHFDPCPSSNLRRYHTQEWNGLLFEHRQHDIVTSLNQIGLSKYFDFSGYAFHSRKDHVCNYNWKTFIEVYLDDYHVVPFHPGLGHFVDCNKLDWQFGDWFSVQSVGVYNKLATPGTDVYKTWHRELLKYRHGAVPEHGAIWLTIYPNVMVEWYPEVLVISTLWPESPQRTRNIVEFYYPEEICHFEADFVAAHQAAYMETCYEDDEIAERMDQGRRHLMQTNALYENGPVHDPMERGLNYFYNYYDNWIISS